MLRKLKSKIKNKSYFVLGCVLTILSIISIKLVETYIIPCKDLLHKDEIEEQSFLEFSDYLENEKIDTIYFGEKSATFFFTLQNDEMIYETVNPNYEQFKHTLLQHKIILKCTDDLKLADQVEEQRRTRSVMVYLIFYGFIIFIFVKAFSNVASGNKKFIVIKSKKKAVANGDESAMDASNVNNKTKVKDVTVKTFDDIAGLVEVKRDMTCLVDFLVHKDKYVEAGAQLPKGVILYGPPGTGKTLLAKAVAGEANVPFLYMSGSEFIEMYVGVGAKRVRELFQSARSQAPCIVFIDEIDAIGGKRTGKDTSGEDRKTINALLTEMDGFKETENIIVIAATNRLEDLDPALTRPGRFTNKFCVPLPSTANERLEIINLYIKNKKLSESINLEALAKETVGFSPAQIESLLNEAAIISVQNSREFIDKEDIDAAMYKVLLQGHIKENQEDRDEEELRVVAWHEAGHALIGKLNGKDITKVTILSSTSGAGGVTFSTPKKTTLLSVEDLKNEVMELYGGRLAETILFNDDETKVTTGASNDIERATSIIHDIVTKYGMLDSFGLLNLENAGVDKEFILSKEVELSKELKDRTHQILSEHFDDLKKIAELLIEKETIYNYDLDFVA